MSETNPARVYETQAATAYRILTTAGLDGGALKSLIVPLAFAYATRGFEKKCALDAAHVDLLELHNKYFSEIGGIEDDYIRFYAKRLIDICDGKGLQ